MPNIDIDDLAAQVAAKLNAPPSQLTREDLADMTAAQIVEAKTQGRLDNILGRTNNEGTNE